ncbi:hypothetical protein ACI2L1_28085 [Streptomyces sp. NPDC019531]|uniref:hypothetical protein n=1 Tax=Streptomyces sp. NPDC019531 TaxID=3365062 RepID=UPI003850319E
MGRRRPRARWTWGAEQPCCLVLTFTADPRELQRPAWSARLQPVYAVLMVVAGRSIGES